MRGVNDRNFLNLWQIVYRATCPGLDRAQWRVGDVEWRKDRHSFNGDVYSFGHEVHFLACRSSRPWRLMVVSEYWWDAERESIRSTTWARVLDGEARAVMAWVFAQERSHRVATRAHHVD